MCENVELSNLVSNIVSEKQHAHCRLCLKIIEGAFLKIDDYIYFNGDNYLRLNEVLGELLSSEIANIADTVPGVDAFCFDCATRAGEAVNFIKQCNTSTRTLNKIFDNLLEKVDKVVQIENHDQSLYIVVDKNQCELILMNNEDDEQKCLNLRCVECSKSFKDIVDLKNHNYQIHSLLTCEKCLDTCSNDSDLNDHEYSDALYMCSECVLMRCTEASLSHHKESIHKVYVCKYCGKSYRGLQKLQEHEKKHLTKYECPKCGKSYTTKDFFTKHVELCLENRIDPHPMRSKIEKKYFCCGKGYSTIGGLRVHQRFVHGNAKYHVCEKCNKHFTARSHLKTHMITHTGEKNFKCDICGNKFVSKEALLYHTRRHTGEKPYSCKQCNEKFVNASARAEHIKFKHSPPTLMCEICSRKFYAPNFLRLHIKKHHDPTNNLYAARAGIPPNVPGEANMRVRLKNSTEGT